MTDFPETNCLLESFDVAGNCDEMTSEEFDLENLIVYAPETAEPDERQESNEDSSEGSQGPKSKVSRKRPRNEDSWEINKRKLKRNSGLEYVGTGGKQVAAKKFLNTACNCRWQCDAKLTPKERKLLFDSFWDLQDFNLQNISLHGMVRAEEVERRRASDNSRGPRQHTFHYYLQPNAEAEPVRVCKRYFLETFQISHGRLYRCCSKPGVSDAVDHRGNPSDDKEQCRLLRTHVEQHVQEFPIYKQRFLSSSLTVRKMYDMYVEECAAQQQLPLSERYYYQVMDTKLSLKLQKERKPTLRRRRRVALLKRMYSREELLRIADAMIRLRRNKRLRVDRGRHRIPQKTDTN